MILRIALVVDDTKSMRMLLKKCLEQVGYEVVQAESGRQAKEYLSSRDFDIVFLDIKMPFMSGTELFKWMVSQGINVPVVVTTAYATVKNAVECTRLGAIAYLQKPFTVDKFKEFIGDLNKQLGQERIKKFRSSQLPEYELLEMARRELDCGNPEGALEHLRQALSQEPSGAEIYRIMSKAYLMLGDKERASKFQKVYELFK